MRRSVHSLLLSLFPLTSSSIYHHHYDVMLIMFTRLVAVDLFSIFHPRSLACLPARKIASLLLFQHFSLSLAASLPCELV
jgi:hypothetical protein